MNIFFIFCSSSLVYQSAELINLLCDRGKTRAPEVYVSKVYAANESSILEGTFEGSLIKNLGGLPRQAYQQCASVSVKRIYNSKDVVDIELAGYKIISTLIELFTTAAMEPDKAYSQLLLNRVSSQYEVRADDVYTRIMAVLDFISGMTDVFALDLYRKINGESIPTIQ